MIALQFLHSGLISFTQANLPNMTYNPANYETCSGRFPGSTYSALFNTVRSSSGIFSTQKDGWPSYYSMFMGFLAGWIGSLPSMYSKELQAVPEKKAASTAGFIILCCLLLLVMVYRILSECEGFMSVSLGLLAGFVVGFCLVMVVSWATDRRATNILSLPLIRNKAVTGQPIYVCERPNTPAEIRE